jgi:ATP-dependent helicase YprA (DUF1998 family)
MALTISQTIAELHRSLREYIEATYHISHPTLIAQRQRLLAEPGVIHQRPYIESTTRYVSEGTFAQIAGLDPAALAVFEAVARPDGELKQLLHDPPYGHQKRAIEGALVEGRSLVVMTGTGSGKTECFVLPILGKLAIEARRRPASFVMPGVRAIVLYPMNALVNDQLGRLRLLLGDPRVASAFTRWTGQPARFARYTSRTLYPGVRTARKDQTKLSPLNEFFVKKLAAAQSASPEEAAHAKRLIRELKERGKWPAKPDLAG